MPARDRVEVCKVWHSMRRPFTLPESATKYHACEWEVIDMGLLGCRVCGSIHACDSLTCKDVIETNEGRVCALSGVVVYDRAYSDLEYLDTLVLSDSMPVSNDFDAEMTCTVRNILSSKLSQNVRRKLLCTTLLHLSHEMQNSSNLMSCCVRFLKSTRKTPYFFDFVSSQRRAELVLDAIKHCGRVMHLMVSNGMSIKPPEVQRITVGLLYLMRCGVAVNGVMVLPQYTEMRQLLPPENTLLKSYGIHPKFITETENRLKFSIRSNLDKLG
jgi:hypothetical protein